MSTSIEQLMNSNPGNGASMNEVDAILEELNNKPQQQQPPPMQPPPNTQPKQITGPPSPQMQQMMHQIQQQQSQLQQLSNMNREKDLFIQQNIQNNDKKTDQPEQPVDLLTEFKSTLIIFSILIIFNLPVLNKFITTSIGIENDNTIFAILKTFIICIIFFLINKFT